MNRDDLSEELKKLAILLVEDNEALRVLARRQLEGRVGRLLMAANGEEGLAMYREHRPDIVISDIMMPVMDGLEMTAAIKAIDHNTPVILATAFDDTEYLLRALAVNADGYLVKPVMPEALIQTLLARTAGYLKDKELAAWRVAAEEERQLIAELMARMMRPEKLDDAQLRYWLKPAESVGGDLIAFARSRNDRIYLMLADSAGHGLPAALNLLPVNHIFYRMAEKCLPVSLIAEEMNHAIREQSPPDRYVAAMLACVDPNNHLVEVWNGGFPAATLLDAETGAPVHSFESAHAPLGVLDKTFRTQTEIHQWRRPCQLLLHSDGLLDAANGTGEAFGAARLMQAARAPSARRLDAVKESVTDHTAGRRCDDDLTLVLLDCSKANAT